MLTIIGQSARVPNTYLLDLGAGWGSVYHHDLRYVEDPRRLDALRLDDPRWQPWQGVADGAGEMTGNAEQAIARTAPARRALLLPQPAVPEGRAAEVSRVPSGRCRR